jgi:hypothetical protein
VAKQNIMAGSICQNKGVYILVAKKYKERKERPGLKILFNDTLPVISFLSTRPYSLKVPHPSDSTTVGE